MLPSRKSGIGFDITSCICTIIKKASLGRRSRPGGIDLSVQLKHRKTERHSMCFRANGQTLIREARLVPNCCSEFCWWSSTCLWSVAFPPECHGCKHRTNAVWLTHGAFAYRTLRIRRPRWMSFYLSMASYLPDFCADGSIYAGFDGDTTRRQRCARSVSRHLSLT